MLEVPLENGLIPNLIEVKLDSRPNLLTEEEHQLLKERSHDLVLSVELRDPQGLPLEVTNTIFQVQPE